MRHQLASAIDHFISTDTLEQTVLLLVCLLPLLIPFGLTRNVNLQALVVVLTGCLGWLAVSKRSHHKRLMQPGWRLAVALYVGCLVLNVAFRPHANNLFGGPLIRLGTTELLAIVGCGLALRHIAPSKLATMLYASICGVSIVSLPYSLLRAHQLVRVGGVFYQPDFLAITVAVGLVIGIGLWQKPGRYRWLVGGLQLYLLVTLFLTQTRAVIGLLVIVTCCMTVRAAVPLRQKCLLIGMLLITVIIGSVLVRPVTDGRLTDKAFASQSTTYRLHLQYYGLTAALQHPAVGFGPGNLAAALACPTLHSADLQYTCHHNYYFDSSHNVFLDRLLAFGWLGGLGFIVSVGWLLWIGLSRDASSPAYAALLVALYYLTNVANLESELLLWMLLMQAVRANRASA